jgi:hypothetical protein
VFRSHQPGRPLLNLVAVAASTHQRH